MKRFVLAATLLLGGFNTAAAMPAPRDVLLHANREISLSATGNLLNYKELIDGPGDRESGWSPGFAAQGSVMFDLGPLANVYGAVRFNYANGMTGYYGNATNLQTNRTVAVDDFSGLTTKVVQVELGKGFFVLPRLLITPVGQFGSRTWERSITPDQPGGYLENYHNKYAGLAVHADYAATPRLVLRARLGWAETFDANVTSGFGDKPFRLGSRPLWQAGAGVDYRAYGRLHVLLNAEYTYFSYGRSPAQPLAPHLFVHEPSSFSSGLVVAGGLGVSF